MMLLSDKRIGSRGGSWQLSETDSKKNDRPCVSECICVDAHRFVITIYWPVGDMSLSARESQEER